MELAVMYSNMAAHLSLCGWGDIVKKHSLSTGASREAPVDKRAHRLNA